MALKRLKTKQSKRVPCNLKYKILKKIRESKRKVRREAKKHNKKGIKQKLIQIPNICPFKEDILKDVEAAKLRAAEEKQLKKEEQRANKTLESMVVDAVKRDDDFEEALTEKNLSPMEPQKKGENDKSLKAYVKEFRKVIDLADVILEVVDARDPLGTRCSEVEAIVKSSVNKRLILILNKADLVPRENLNKWLKYFKRFGPVTVFKASTQNQNNRLGQRKMNMKNEKLMKGSMCIGAELLMSMLANYCRNKDIKTSISVGIVGIPNVGKSSIINSLTRGKTCNIGCAPGVTKTMQEVELDSKIKLIDCPGIIFPNLNSTDTAVLRNAQRISDVKDPFTVAETILKRASKMYFCKLYDITEYETSEEFFSKKAARMGKFLRGGIPDVMAAARSLLNDWNTGKIKYCTQPPEDIVTDVHLGASIVQNSNTKEFDIENFQEMEMDILNKFDENHKDDEVLLIKSDDATNSKMEMDEEYKELTNNVQIIEEKPSSKSDNNKKTKSTTDNTKTKTTNRKIALVLEGNQMLNKNNKLSVKKMKKKLKRCQKKVDNVSDILENFSL